MSARGHRANDPRGGLRRCNERCPTRGGRRRNGTVRARSLFGAGRAIRNREAQLRGASVRLAGAARDLGNQRGADARRDRCRCHRRRHRVYGRQRRGARARLLAAGSLLAARGRRSDFAMFTAVAAPWRFLVPAFALSRGELFLPRFASPGGCSRRGAGRITGPTRTPAACWPALRREPSARCVRRCRLTLCGLFALGRGFVLGASSRARGPRGRRTCFPRSGRTCRRRPVCSWRLGRTWNRDDRRRIDRLGRRARQRGLGRRRRRGQARGIRRFGVGARRGARLYGPDHGRGEQRDEHDAHGRPSAHGSHACHG